MKNWIYFLKIFGCFIIAGCDNFKNCAESSNDAFEEFKLSVEKKILPNSLSSNYGTFKIYIDTIFNILDKPTIEFIPKEIDGAYGIHKNYGKEIYYAKLMNHGKLHSKIGVMIGENKNCYKVINIAYVRPRGKKDYDAVDFKKKKEFKKDKPSNSYQNTDDIKETTTWYAGGSLHAGNGLDWIKATESNKLATCADFIMTISKKKGELPSVFSSEFRKASEFLKNCIEIYYDLPSNRDVTVSKAAITCVSPAL